MDNKENTSSGNSLFDSLKNAAENVVNLQIVTIIGDVTISGSIRNPQVDFPDGEPSADHTVIATNINLIESDITSVIPKKYAEQADNPVMKYHAEQVAQANATMDQKVKMFKALFEDIVPLIGGEHKPPDPS